jgi:hypothetical protein
MKRKVVRREQTFSSFRVVSNGDKHWLEVRDHSQEWKRDATTFTSQEKLVAFCKNKLRMQLHGKGPYLEDMDHPGKPPCWHAGVAKHIDLTT